MAQQRAIYISVGLAAALFVYGQAKGKESPGLWDRARAWTDRSAPSWPPRAGRPYPDLELRDQTGEIFRLSSLKGKVILVETASMVCKACQAFAGGHEKGGFRGVAPQPGLPALEQLLPRYGSGVTLDDPRIAYVQLLLYGTEADPPAPGDAKAWADHFGMDRSKNKIVLTGTRALLGPATRQLVPGFQLIDKKFVLRADATGPRQPELYTGLLPMVPTLLAEN